MKSLFRELKRRNVYRVAVAYAVVAWLLLQALSILLPAFEAPAWVLRVFIAAITAGLPLALVFAWAFELTPQGIKRADEVPAEQSIAHDTGRKLVAVVVVIAAIAAGLLVYQLTRSSGSMLNESRSAPATALPEKSIAVLPFENFSDNKENAFFADGIQDDILTSLAKISELKVISRTSVMGYRGGASRNLREIARVLGVTNVLEGSVRRVSDRVLVNVQLIDAINDRHIWADRYDRTIQDAIALQGELATEIAAVLRAKLSPGEKARVEKKPTENAEAYTWYLKGREIESRPDISLDYYRENEACYARAIALDPSFALAHAKLAMASAAIYHEFEPTEAWNLRARAAADEALRLNPESGEAHIALGHWYYWVAGDYDTALRELAVAEKLSPNSVDVPQGIAAIRRRQGRWRESLSEYKRAQSLDPRNGSIAQETTFTFFALRDWPASRTMADGLLAIAPSSPTAWMFRAYGEIFERGDVSAAEQIFARCPRENSSAANAAFMLPQLEFAMLKRDFQGAEEILAILPQDSFAVPSGPPVSKAYLEGCLALARGDATRGRPQFEKASAELERYVLESPNDASRHGSLGLVYAFLGRKEEAIREGQRAVELKPENRDALVGPIFAANLALIYAWTGETAQALALLERLRTTPGAVAFFDASVTWQDLRLRWQWDPLRSEARFQQLLASPEPKTTY